MPLNQEKLELFLGQLERPHIKFVAVDTESNGHDLRDGSGQTHGLSVSFRVHDALPPFSAYFSMRHGDFQFPDSVFERLFAILHTKTLIFHNAKHDLVALADLGFVFTGRFFDTMLMVHLLDENLPNKSLDYTARWYLGEHKERSAKMQAWIDIFGWENITNELIEEYAEHDALITLLLFEHLWPKFQAEKLLDYWTDEQEFIRALIDIEGTGVRLDDTFCNREIERGHEIMREIMARIGRNPSAPTDLQALLLDELNLPVVKQTPSGKPSFDKHAMAEYDILLSDLGSELAKDILTYRGWAKAISSSYTNYLKYMSPDGRVRPNYKIHGTVTGRLSCEKPNLQQIPRTSNHDWDGGLKAAFIASDGWELWDFDYKNLELRLGAAYAGEENLRNIFAAGRDVFTEMAAELGFSRQDTKTLVYTMQFGGGRQRIADVFGVSLTEAELIRDRFFQRYPGMYEAMKKAERTANKNTKVKLWSGRYRHFDSTEHTYKAFNAAIQGGAADIVKRQIVRVHHSLDPDEARILLTVHDSIVVEIREDRVEVLVPKIKEMMETVIPDFGVKFGVDAKKWGS